MVRAPASRSEKEEAAMPFYKYLGMTDEQQKAYVDQMTARAVPAEAAGQSPIYRMDATDNPLEIERKKERLAKWKAKRREEYKADVAARAVKATVCGIEFPVGEVVEVEPDESDHVRTYALKKLEFLCTKRGGPKFAKVEKVNNTPKPKPEPEEPVKRGPGRPKKTEE